MRLIDAGRAIFIATESAYLTEEDMDSFAYIINSTPTVDAVPVVHGRWVDDETNFIHYCSVCKRINRVTTYKPNYCPHCGAKMDGRMVHNDR